MSITIAYKYRIYPDASQRQLMAETFGCCRYVYNHMLAERISLYKESGASVSYNTQAKELPTLKETNPWLKDVDSTALQSAARNLDNAYGRFFENVKAGKKPGFPRFKSKRSRQSYTSKRVGSNIAVSDDAVRLPKLGWVKASVSRKVMGRILSATVSRDPDGKFYVSVCCTDADIKPLPHSGAAVGVDLGIKSLAVTSDGEAFENHKYLGQSEERLARLQRQLSRKQRGSRRYGKARRALARLHKKIADRRRDALHKLTTKLVREYGTICVEDLSPSGMAGDHRLAGAISDASWGEIRRQLAYKSGWYGRDFVIVDRWYPSSQTCSSCGAVWPGTKDLSVRKWACPVCGAVHDRDVNAAVNILNEGLRLFKTA